MSCRFFLLVSSLCLALAACSRTESPNATADNKSTPVAQQSPRQPVAPVAPIDPCSLLTSEEIAAVQAEAVVGTKPSSNQGQGLAIYDCFYTLPTFTNSISLSVTQNGPGPDARDAKQWWQETFASAMAKASEKSPPPDKVDGIGDEAYWTGDARMGALYVLKGSRALRISVGGPATEKAQKVEKTRALAEAALKRL